MTKSGHLTIVASSKDDDDAEKSTRLITFLGKGGSGKTTTAVFAAQHYAREGLSTCLVTHSQDHTADYLLNRKIGNVPIICSNNLSAARLETTKMLLDPLNRLKQADAHVNMTQGVLEGIVGEELGVLPGMDSIFSAFALEGFIGFHGNAAQRKDNDKFDVIIYDGISPEETLRLLGASKAARLYVKYLRSMAEKTDLGRLAGPSLLRLVYEAMISSSNGPIFDGKLSSEIWDYIETFLERKSSAFAQPEKFGCYIVMNPCSKINVDTAIRYWGCTLQAGAQVSGAFAIASPHFRGEPVESIKKSFSPLPFAFIPNLSMDSPLDWDAIMQNSSSDDARNLLHLSANRTTSNVPLVKYDLPKKSITLFMPGFDKSEIKLYQYRGRSELLVEAGDQRRVIQLPREVQGKVAGAKFIDRNLVITMS
ncbi:hypothetical protein Nepgr_003688 [Nepenthes gracilis]|uniref:Uncharacterized protein n=1 Tax=Nepenthes gracilis TaxID=150966 RepID=A0AAD3S040_NEPGR|nr:hypothetical protein Nepgr_003688 [Nepenthes gracilis]